VSTRDSATKLPADCARLQLNWHASATTRRPVDSQRATRISADFREIAELELAHVEGVQARVGATTVAYVPYLSRDVHDFSALREIGGVLFDPAVGSAPHART